MPRSSPLPSRAVVAGLKETVPNLIAAYVFGSANDGRSHGGSDVDLAVLGECPLTARERWNAQERLAVCLGRDVDLVDLRGASTVMQMQVVSTGRVLYERERAERDHFEVRVYSSYALLNEERRAILDAIERRGQIYGR